MHGLVCTKNTCVFFFLSNCSPNLRMRGEMRGEMRGDPICELPHSSNQRTRVFGHNHYSFHLSLVYFFNCSRSVFIIQVLFIFKLRLEVNPT